MKTTDGRSPIRGPGRKSPPTTGSRDWTSAWQYGRSPGGKRHGEKSKTTTSTGSRAAAASTPSSPSGTYGKSPGSTLTNQKPPGCPHATSTAHAATTEPRAATRVATAASPTAHPARNAGAPDGTPRSSYARSASYPWLKPTLSMAGAATAASPMPQLPPLAQVLRPALRPVEHPGLSPVIHFCAELGHTRPQAYPLRSPAGRTVAEPQRLASILWESRLRYSLWRCPARSPHRCCLLYTSPSPRD